MDCESLQSCCGVGEIMNMDEKDPKTTFFSSGDMTRMYKEYNVYVFADNINRDGKSRGVRFANFLRRNRLGRLTRSTPVENNNHKGHLICIWTFYPNHESIDKYWKKYYNKWSKESSYW